VARVLSGNCLQAALLLGLVLNSFSPVHSFSLADAYEAALAKESQFQAARARELADRELSTQALAELLPRVSVTANRFEVKQQREDDGLELPRQEYPSEGAVLSLRQPIFNPRLFSQYRRAVALGESGGAVLSAERQGLANRVASGFATLVLSYERKRLLEAQVRSGVARLDAANRAWRAGTGTKTDINEIQAQLDLLRAQMLQAEQSILVAQADFERTTGMSFKTPLRFGAKGILLSRLQLGALESLLNLLPLENPEVVAARHRAQATRHLARSSLYEHSPTIDFVMESSYSAGENNLFIETKTRSNSIGVQVTVPIFQGGGTLSRNRQTAAEVKFAEESYEQSLETARIEMSRSYYALREGTARALALERAEESAQQVVLANQKSFQAGIRTTLDILAAEQRLATVSLDLVEARLQLIIAWIRVHGLLNRVNRDTFDVFAEWFETRDEANLAAQGPK